jgi:hypothetical protein
MRVPLFVLAASVALVSSSEASAPGAEPAIFIGAGPYVPWVNPPPVLPAWWKKRPTGEAMFGKAGDVEWPSVAAHTTAVMTSTYPVQASCLENRFGPNQKTCADLGTPNERSLDQYFRAIKANHFQFVLETGLLLDTQIIGTAVTQTCAKEAFGREAALRAMLQKIKDAGGTVDILRMDEPFHFGTLSCTDTIPNIAQDIARAIPIVRSYFPNARIGDVEPVTGAPDQPAIVGERLDAYRAAVGAPPAFFHVDAAWNVGPAIRNFPLIARIAHERGVPFGVIYDADDERTDQDWTRSAIAHFTEVESGPRPFVNQAIFQSWTAFPTETLPEQTPGKLMNVPFQYVLPKTVIAAQQNGASIDARLTDTAGTAISGAPMTAEIVDAADRWHERTTRVFAGQTPPNAAFAVIGIRVNGEGTAAFAPGRIELGQMVLHYKDAAGQSQTWKSNYPVPDRIAVSPQQTLSLNLPTGQTPCGAIPAIPVAPDSPYSLEVPVSATLSADRAGYATVIFFDSQCQGFARSFLYFKPASRPLPDTTTNETGQALLPLPTDVPISGSELRLHYAGDNATHRPSMTSLRLQ